MSDQVEWNNLEYDILICPYCNDEREIEFDHFEGIKEQDGHERNIWCYRCQKYYKALIGWYPVFTSRTKKIIED